MSTISQTRFDHDFAMNGPDDEDISIPDHEKHVTVVLRDAHDTKGPGMRASHHWLGTLKHLFDHFKARSCDTCRAPNEMRFKTADGPVSESDSPESLGLPHQAILQITAWSNTPGLLCGVCKYTGYPRTNYTDSALRDAPPASIASPPIPETVTLRVRDQTGFETSIKMLNSVGFRYLMEQYAEMAFHDLQICRFLFDGERLAPEETPKMLGMITNDRVDVVFE